MLQLALAPPMMVMKGLAAPEFGAVHTRALDLCRQLDDPPQLFRTLWGAWIYYLARAEVQTARELTEQLMLLALRAQDSALIMEAHYGLGTVLYSLGDVASARTHFEQVLTLYDPGQRHSGIARRGVDLRVASLSRLTHVLWLLGYPKQAMRQSREALTLAQEINHRWSTAVVWIFNTTLRQFLREAQAVQQQAEALIAICNEQGFSAFLAMAIAPRGWALVEQGQQEGIVQLCQGMIAARAAGAELSRPHHLALLAEAYGKTEQIEEGLTALAEALTSVIQSGVSYYEAELYRLKGELTLQQKSQEHGSGSTAQEAEECFCKAIEIAQHQQAKSLELRATVSLARLWQKQGKKAEAHQMLFEIYDWFTEGFDTTDLQEAKTLLKALSD
jgi:tetratricopeptide (TPR) repeat protein